MNKAPSSQPLVPGHYQITSSRRRHLLLDLPIAWRLTLGFLLAALIAAAAAGLTGIQRAQSAGREADFYQNLLVVNTSLTTANSFLELLDTEVHTTLDDAAVPDPSQETLGDDQSAVTNLTNLYNGTLNGFTGAQLLREHPDEVAMLGEAEDAGEVGQQNTLVASVLRTWQFYRAAQTQVMADIAGGDPGAAEALERAQGEPTNSDAQSALRALIEFDNQIAASVNDAAQVEQQNQLFISLIAAVIAFLCIGGVGWVISESLVTRLNQLRRVTLSVEEGDVGQRVVVTGRDEVADVSASVNGMLDTIVGLLEVTRRQRDALTNAAERLFTDVRLAGTGDLRINAAVGGDPIGMLANAFNFTIGRFRRFVLRTQTSVEQLDVLARQQLDRAESFLAIARASVSGTGGAAETRSRGRPPYASAADGSPAAPELRLQAQRSRELVRRIARDGAAYRARELRDYAEQAYLSAGRVSQLAVSAGAALEQRSAGAVEHSLRSQLEELRTLGKLLAQLGAAAYGVAQNSSQELTELDAAIVRLSNLALDAAVPAGPSVPTAGGDAPAASEPASPGNSDLARNSAIFARDMAQVARQIGVITHELRTGVMPFRVEAGADESSLYAPGTGTGTGTGYGAYGGYAGYGEAAPHSNPAPRPGVSVQEQGSYPPPPPRPSRPYDLR